MLEIVKNMHFATDGLRRDDLVRLGHSARPVHFTHVVDLHFDLDAFLPRLIPLLIVGCGRTTTTHNLCDCRFADLQSLVELSGVFRRLEWDLDFDYLDVVLLVVGRVSANQQSLDREVTTVGTTEEVRRARARTFLWLDVCVCAWGQQLTCPSSGATQ